MTNSLRTIILVVGVMVLTVLLVLVLPRNPRSIHDNTEVGRVNIDLAIVSPTKKDIKVFESASDFKEYLSISDKLVGYNSGFRVSGGLFGTRGVKEFLTSPMAFESNGMMLKDESSTQNTAPDSNQYTSTDRVSTTNVQVIGVDEPDIVKSDGEEIYFSSPSFVNYLDDRSAFPNVDSESFIDDVFLEEVQAQRILPRWPQKKYGGVKVINAFPPADIEVNNTLDVHGEMLLYKDNLVVFSGNIIHGYDVSSPEKPSESWDIKLQNGTQVVTSRLYGDMVYLVTRTWVNRDKLCPIVPLSIQGDDMVVTCSSIHYPVSPIYIDSTYTIMKLDPISGEISQTKSFVGSSGQSVVYVSSDAIYITYQQTGDFVNYIIGFFKENSDLVSTQIIDRLEKLQTYELSNQAKLAELSVIITEFSNSMDGDSKLLMENEFENRSSDYGKKHMRDLELMGIVKVNINSLEIEATGGVPGSPLNQFSLDEYDGYLRVVTTINPQRSLMSQIGGGTVESENDLYVLNSNLKQISSVEGLGLTEKVFAVRFVQDKGYVVTFRQTDPFYVIDLSNPHDVFVAGELKIPGFSSYLHPITKDFILGVGREGSKVKLSLFDVSDPTNPTEKSKYTLGEHWTDIQNTHHAFLLDDKHKIFFIPGNKGGYIFSYKEGESLELRKAVSNIRARRAVFINDYLYIIGDDKMVVLSETDWERLNELSF